MTGSVQQRVERLEQHHGLGGRTYVIAKDRTEPHDQAVTLAGIEPTDADTVIITNYYFGSHGVDQSDRCLLTVW